MKTIIFKPLGSIWLKASVIGSFWASVEIILGSFLHNLKIPLSGTILSFISVYLLISFLQIWKERGLILRAGLVCALMKSISPSAIILGPMIGIFTEALLLELSIWIAGRNIIGYLIGGGFAVLSALLHKLFSLLILYGIDFIKILSSMYQFAVKQIHLSNLDPMPLIILIIGIYLAAGVTAAAAGYLTGNKYLKNRKLMNDRTSIEIQTKNQLFSESTNQQYSVFYLILNISAVVISLLLINLEFTLLSILFPLLYIGFCIFHYKSSLNRLKKISIWLQFAVITIIAAFLWNGISEKSFFTVSGLLIGIKMVSRAVIVIIGFATISIELKNPLIKSVLYKKGLANLYQSVNLAFSALPGIISGLPESKSIFKKPDMFFYGIINQAETLLIQFEKKDLVKPEIIIISGEKREGKTTFVSRLVDNLKDQNIQIIGFLSIGIHENNRRTGFDIFDLQTSQKVGLCTKTRHKGWFSFGDYYFNPEGISKGNEILDINNLNNTQLVVIDEVGPVELNGQGWSDAIEALCQASSVPQLWVVRKSLLDVIIRKWNTGNIYLFDISEDTLKDVENKILEIIPFSLY